MALANKEIAVRWTNQASFLVASVWPRDATSKCLGVCSFQLLRRSQQRHQGKVSGRPYLPRGAAWRTALPCCLWDFREVAVPVALGLWQDASSMTCMAQLQKGFFQGSWYKDLEKRGVWSPYVCIQGQQEVARRCWKGLSR